MSIVEIKQHAEQKMLQSLDSFKNSLTKIRTGRANPGLLDTVHVDYYGSRVPKSKKPFVIPIWASILHPRVT
jgi:ribosome recycling factor